MTGFRQQSPVNVSEATAGNQLQNWSESLWKRFQRSPHSDANGSSDFSTPLAQARAVCLEPLGVPLAIAAVGLLGGAFKTVSLDHSPQGNYVVEGVEVLFNDAEADVAAEELDPFQVSVETINAGGATRNQVKVNDTAVVSLGEGESERAQIIANRIESLILDAESELEIDTTTISSASEVMPELVNGYTVGAIDEQVLFTVDEETADWYGQTPEDLTVMWVNNLRIALGGDPIAQTDAINYRYESRLGAIDLEGLASWYGPHFYGRPTASGELFVPGTMTAAHKSLPLGTYLHVTAPNTGRSVVVRVNDRGPYVGARILDLSETAARELGVLESGVAQVQIRIIDPENQQQPS